MALPFSASFRRKLCGGTGLPFFARWLAGSGSIAGATPTAFATAPSVHYHFNSQTVTVDGNNRLVSCPDRMGLAQLLAVSGATAPMLMTDALGRKFLRFNGSEAAVIENALNAVANRGFSIMAVIRVPHARSTVQIVNPRFAAYTSDSVNTAANASIGYMRATVTSSSAPFLQAGSPAASTNATDCYKVIPHAGLQVLTIASRTTANGGTRLYQNNDVCDVAQQTTSVTGYIGAIIGGTAGASNTAAVTTSVNNVFDLYELAFWNSSLLNAATDPIAAAAVTNYGIAQLDTNLVLEGDSITDGIATVLGVSPAWSGSISSQLTQPGAMWVPANVRVLSLGTSGNTITNLVTKRDATNSVFASGKYPGGAAKNVIACQIGRNDMGTVGNLPSSTFYTNLVALINTTTTGYLQRGWSFWSVGNIGTSNTATTGNSPAGENTIQLRIEGARAKIFDGGAGINATFQSDVLAGAGQAYDGLVKVLPLHLVTVGGDTKLLTNADALDTASGYYDNDQTHLTTAGALLMASGGDTPAYGYGAIL